MSTRFVRLSVLLLAAALCGPAAGTASARAADPVVVNQRVLFGPSALDGNLLYVAKTASGTRVCMRKVGGKLRRAHLSASYCGGGPMGLDSRGRVVYLYAIYRRKGASGVPVRWYAYDLKGDRIRQVKGAPGPQMHRPGPCDLA